MPNCLPTLISSSERCDVYSQLGDQGAVRSAPETFLRNIEIPPPTVATEQRGLRKTFSIDPCGQEGGEDERPARKRRFGIDRVDEYDTGGSIDDAGTHFSEGTRFDLRAMICS